jgi:dTDP-4-amino-4,6-dideoxygalactose transaminase
MEIKQSGYRINFGELRIGDLAKQRIKKAIDKCWISEGENVKEFEDSFADLFKFKHAIAMSSGTDADLCACASLYEFGAKRGDEIIVPALCYVSCANSILAAGFIPKFVDIELETLNINPNKMEGAITIKTKAIMLVSTMGKPCEIDTIMEIAKKHDLIVISDDCEAHGAIYKGKFIGNLVDMATYSFYVAHIVSSGEGGMVVTNRDDIDKVVRSVKTHGRPFGSIYFDFQRIGFNSRMNELTAAIGIEGVSQFRQTFDIRRKNLKKLLYLIKPLRDCCYFLKEEPYEIVSPHAFPIVLKDKKLDRNKLHQYLSSRGIQCKTLFGSLPTQHRAFKFMGYKLGDFPVAEYVGNNGLHFGVHQYLTKEDLIYISETLAEYFGVK